MIGRPTYTPAPRSDVDRIRTLIGDTDLSDPQFPDDALIMYLDLAGNSTPLTTRSTRPVLYRAASLAASGLAAHYARSYDSTSGPEKRNAAAIFAHYRALAASLWQQAVAVAGPRVGGMSIAGKQADRQDTDLVQPFFSRDQFSEPGVGPDVPIAGTLLVDPTS